MHTRLLHESDGRRVFALVFDIGDEVAEELARFAREHELEGAHLTALGALSDVTLGYWRWEEKDYERIEIREQVEVLALVGNIARGPDGEPRVHAHLVVGKRDGSAHGGHLLEAHVRPTLELVVTEEPRHMQRRFDENTGLALLAGEDSTAMRR